MHCPICLKDFNTAGECECKREPLIDMCIDYSCVGEIKVVHPDHYNKGIETWDYTTSHNMDFLQGNVVKYVTRFRDKDGMKDLRKAQQYLEKLIAVEEAKDGR